jgi:hypothetical protein
LTSKEEIMLPSSVDISQKILGVNILRMYLLKINKKYMFSGTKVIIR